MDTNTPVTSTKGSIIEMLGALAVLVLAVILLACEFAFPVWLLIELRNFVIDPAGATWLQCVLLAILIQANYSIFATKLSQGRGKGK